MLQRVCGMQEAAELCLLEEVEELVEGELLVHSYPLLKISKMAVLPLVVEEVSSNERLAGSHAEQLGTL